MTTFWKRAEGAPGRSYIDPYLAWAVQSDRVRDLLRGEGIPLLFQLNIPAVRFARGEWIKDHPRSDDWMTWLKIPHVYAYPSAGLRDTTFCTGVVTDTFFTKLEEDEQLRQAVKRFQFGLPVGPVRPTEINPIQPIAPGAAKHVVTAVIDDALAFAHERFRRANGSSRIEYFWDQDGPASNVPGFNYGREHVGNDITQWMAANRHAGIVDEDAVYRISGAEDYTIPNHKALGRRCAHGTHVMDIACGLDPTVAGSHFLPIIGVQLPARTVRDTSGAFLWPQVYEGLRYILDRADRIAATTGSGTLPVVVNLSYGTIAGPHDGSSPLETAIDELIQLRSKAAPLEIVLPSGNQYLYCCHAQLKLSTGEQRTLNWRVLPDDKTPNFLEIWIPIADLQGPRQIKLSITTPTGDQSPPIFEGDHYVWRPHAAVLCDVLYLATPASGDRPLVQISGAATATLDAANEVAPCGIWQITIENVGPEAVIDAWIQRDDTPFGWPILGRQSRFEDPEYVRFDSKGEEEDADSAASYIKRAGSINGLATGNRPVVVGGCRFSDLASAKYSAAGPVVPRANSITTGTGEVLAPRNRLDPDAMAISDTSMNCHGVLAAGTRSGGVFALNGTSVAAPQLTRWIAGQMRKNAPSDGTAVEQLAQLEEAARSVHLPSNRQGAGRINDKLPPAKVQRWTPW